MKHNEYLDEKVLLKYLLKQADEFALAITLLECVVLNQRSMRYIMDLLDWRKQVIEHFNPNQLFGGRNLVNRSSKHAIPSNHA